MSDTPEPSAAPGNGGQHSAPAAADQQQAPAAERAGYLGFVAHEMRNPLSTALWSAELLGRLSVEDRGGARGQKLTGMCLRTLTRLRVLLEDYFLVERLGIGGIPLKTESVPLAPVIEQACSRLDADVSIPPLPDISVVADPSMLERLVESLVAVAARDSAAKIDLAVRGGRVHLRVSGAPPQADGLSMPTKATPSDPSGRALALLVAKAVAEAHGGVVRLDPDAYIAELPLEQPAGRES